MKDQSRENLAELIERFFHGEQASGVMEDVRRGEQLLRDNPAPEPDHRLIADIKAEIALLVPARRTRLAGWTMFRKVAAAAAIIIIAAISAVLFDGGPPGPGAPQLAGLLPTAIWESNDIAADDENLAVLAAEIDQIQSVVITLESVNDSYESGRTVRELEIELIVIHGDFWKE
jgi:hypothetical protein